MPTSAAGSRSLQPGAAGFTLLEILIVLVIVAIAASAVMLALPDSQRTLLERDAQRLTAMLEAARADARTLGVAATWRGDAQGFMFEGIAHRSGTTAWLSPLQIEPASATLVLGPEPMIGAQAVTLRSSAEPQWAWTITTDGIRAFQMQPHTAVALSP